MGCGLSVGFRLVNDLQYKNLSIFITALQELFEVCVSSLKVFLPFTALPTTSFELPNFFVRGVMSDARTNKKLQLFFVRWTCAAAHKRTNCARFPAPALSMVFSAL